MHAYALCDVPGHGQVLGGDGALVEDVEDVLVLHRVDVFEEAQLVGAAQLGTVTHEVHAAGALLVVDDDASVRTRAALKVRVGNVLQRAHGVQALGLREQAVGLGPEHVAQHVDGVVEELHLLARFVEHVVHGRVELQHGVAKVLHGAQLHNVAYAHHAAMQPVKVLHQDASEEAVEVDPVRKGDALRAVRIESQQRALHAAQEVLHAVVRVGRPLHLPLRTLGPPSERGALPQREVHLVEAVVLAALVQDAHGVLSHVRQVVGVRDAGARQHHTGHQVAIDLVLHVLACAQHAVQLVQYVIGLFVVLHEDVGVRPLPL